MPLKTLIIVVPEELNIVTTLQNAGVPHPRVTLVSPRSLRIAAEEIEDREIFQASLEQPKGAK